jgi:hypothetical protein
MKLEMPCLETFEACRADSRIDGEYPPEQSVPSPTLTPPSIIQRTLELWVALSRVRRFRRSCFEIRGRPVLRSHRNDRPPPPTPKNKAPQPNKSKPNTLVPVKTNLTNKADPPTATKAKKPKPIPPPPTPNRRNARPT